MSLAKFHADAARIAVRVLTVAACGVTLAGCENLASMNHFNWG